MGRESNVTPAKSPFRICSNCGWRWATLADFLSDVNIVSIGYQVDFDKLEAGLLLFNHMTPACGTTLAAHVGDFRGLYNGPVFRERLTGGPQCSGYCLKRDAFELCPSKCECAYVREILIIVKNWPKKKPDKERL